MSVQRKILAAVFGWLVVVSVLHVALNTQWMDSSSSQTLPGKRFRVGFLPVT